MSATHRDNHGEPVLALVTEAFLDWPLQELLDWLLAEAPEIRALEIGSGGYARAEHPELLICLELHPGTVVYNAETFSALASLPPNLAANIDPSHFFWQHMDAFAVVDALAGRIGHAHAKDLAFNPDVLAT